MWNPFRSKLAAAIVGGIENVWITPGTKVLYLGAASGTSVSHVSDIVGPVSETQRHASSTQTVARTSPRLPSVCFSIACAWLPCDDAVCSWCVAHRRAWYTLSSSRTGLVVT